MSAESVPVDEGTKETVRELARMCNSLQTEVRELKERDREKDERIECLERENQSKDALINAYRKKMGRMEKVIIGEERSIAEEEFDVADSIWTQLQETREIAENSLSVAKTNTKRENNTTKKEIAKTLSRDETVVSSIRTSQKAAAVDCDDVIQMAKPDTRLEHRTILDAWSELEDEEKAFEVIEREGPDGQVRKMLRCYTESLSAVLVRAVKNDLSDPEATESLNSWLASEGVR